MSAEAALPPPVGADAPPPPAGPGAPKTVRSWSTAQLKRTLRLANLCNGVTLITLGIIVFLVAGATASFTNITIRSARARTPACAARRRSIRLSARRCWRVAKTRPPRPSLPSPTPARSIYTCFFGLLLSCLECNISNLAPRLQRNFGFMFSFTGRTLFIVFCGSMAFAMGNTLAYVVGSLTVLNGLFNGYVICVHPAFKTGELSAKGDPYGGYSGGEKEMLTYLQSKPELARQAQGAAVSWAAANPGAAMQVMHAAAPGAPVQGGHV